MSNVERDAGIYVRAANRKSSAHKGGHRRVWATVAATGRGGASLALRRLGMPREGHNRPDAARAGDFLARARR